MSTFITVGNAKQPFHRLLEAAASLIPHLPQPVVVQHGETPFQCDHCQVVQFLDMARFEQLVTESRLLIMHAGAGSVIHAIRSGKLPVIMPRRKQHGEHVDDHQLEFASALESTGRVMLAEDAKDLEHAITRALANQQPPSSSTSSQPDMVQLVAGVLKHCANQRRSN